MEKVLAGERNRFTQVEQGLVQVAGDLVNMEKAEKSLMVDEGESSHNAVEALWYEVLEHMSRWSSNWAAMMVVEVPLPLSAMIGAGTPQAMRDALAAFYASSPVVRMGRDPDGELLLLTARQVAATAAEHGFQDRKEREDLVGHEPVLAGDRGIDRRIAPITRRACPCLRNAPLYA